MAPRNGAYLKYLMVSADFTRVRRVWAGRSRLGRTGRRYVASSALLMLFSLFRGTFAVLSRGSMHPLPPTPSVSTFVRSSPAPRKLRSEEPARHIRPIGSRLGVLEAVSVSSRAKVGTLLLAHRDPYGSGHRPVINHMSLRQSKTISFGEYLYPLYRSYTRCA